MSLLEDLSKKLYVTVYNQQRKLLILEFLKCSKQYNSYIDTQRFLNNQSWYFELFNLINFVLLKLKLSHHQAVGIKT